MSDGIFARGRQLFAATLLEERPENVVGLDELVRLLPVTCVCEDREGERREEGNERRNFFYQCIFSLGS